MNQYKFNYKLFTDNIERMTDEVKIIEYLMNAFLAHMAALDISITEDRYDQLPDYFKTYFKKLEPSKEDI